jgi:Zn ribbon nucleic-acid-binding protein
MDGRCDRCSAASVAEWWKAEGQRLLELCGHHDRENDAALVAAGWARYEHLDDHADTTKHAKT